MEIWSKAIDVLGKITIIAGLAMIAMALIQLFVSYGSQNADSKNHSAMLLAGGVGVAVVGAVLIPMIGSQIGF